MSTKEEREVKPVTTTLANKIWNDIKDKKIEMFALPEQFVHMYCQPVNIEPSKLYITLSASAALPALEEAIKDKYSVERMDKYICITVK